MNTKIKIKKGDEVIVNVGKNKGKTGKILKIIPSKNKVIVSGINIFKKHTKPNNNDTGGIKEKEMPLHISNVSEDYDNYIESLQDSNLMFFNDC